LRLPRGQPIFPILPIVTSCPRCSLVA
jgi:hypothetical protein